MTNPEDLDECWLCKTQPAIKGAYFCDQCIESLVQNEALEVANILAAQIQHEWVEKCKWRDACNRIIDEQIAWIKSMREKIGGM